MLVAALETEVAAYLEAHREERGDLGLQCRHEHPAGSDSSHRRTPTSNGAKKAFIKFDLSTLPAGTSGSQVTRATPLATGAIPSPARTNYPPGGPTVPPESGMVQVY